MADVGWTEKAKFLVTGGAGFIGSHFAKRLVKDYPGARVVVLDKLTYAGNLDNLRELEKEDRFTFVRGDICDAEKVGEVMESCDVCVNFAAETHVDRSLGDASSFVLTDVYGTHVLLEAARRFGLKRFVQVSTDEVYGEILGDPVSEDSPLMPTNPYAASKAGGDRIAFSYYASFGVPVVITRCSNNYGSHQYPEKLFPLFITNVLEGKKLPVYGSGRNTRDWIHVEDHCSALEALMEAEGVEGLVFNIGSGNELSVLDIAEKILRLLDGSEGLIEHVTDRPAHDRRYALNTDRIRAKVDWASRIDFDQGLSDTVRWYRENRWWWEKIKSGETYRKYYEKMYDR
ncbi:MAG: dTDP-glucose 4,6-dehydratase [Candidatus Eiseniibacteriota bacterium]|nr:MAG: dTDP-glucose 4,6-dehydratase [Candidatus Eisenbacteria bacterium]